MINDWFSDYLKKRNPRIVVDSEVPLLTNLVFGVPQESMLGSILLLIFVNNLPNILKNTYLISSHLYHTLNAIGARTLNNRLKIQKYFKIFLHQ